MLDIAERLSAALSGRYVVDREIGRGGNAVVLRARDVRHERWVALKVLRPDISSSLGAERFLREIRVAAALQHPHILPVHDSGEAAGLLFYVMPYVEGESLRARVERERQLPLDDALRTAREVADALQYAHERDVVHRDIKPENILLSGGHALVADFGIARAINAAAGMKLTETGLAVGTPAYMAPEQVDSDGRIDGRADIYALGCTLYEMLAGEPPYRGPTPQAILRQHSLNAIPLVRGVRPSVPDVVELAITRAMAKAPADRFATANAFAGALPMTTSTAVAAVPQRRSRWLVAASATAAVLAVGGTWAGTRAWSSMRSTEPVSIAVAPIRVSDSADVAFADGLTQEVTTALARVQRIAPRPYATVAVEAAKERDPVALGRKLDVEYVLAAALRRSGRQLRMTTELIRVKDGTNVWSPTSYQGSDAELFLMQDSISSRLVRELAGNFVPQPSRTREPNPEAYKLYLQGKAVSTISDAGSAYAVQKFSEAIERDSNFAGAWAGLANALSNRLQVTGESPVAVVRRIEEAARRALALDSTAAPAWIALAWLSWNLYWDAQEADLLFSRAVHEQPSNAWTHVEYGKFLHTMELLDSALAEVRRAIRLDPTNSHAVMIESYQLQTVGRLREADSLAIRAIAIDPDNWVAFIMRAKIALKEKRFADAIQACRTTERLQGSENPFSMGFAGFCYGKAGDATNAQRILKTLSEMSRRRFVQRAALVWARLGVGDRAGAINDLELAAAARDYDFTLLMRESAADLWNEPRYQVLLRRSKLDKLWQEPPVP